MTLIYKDEFINDPKGVPHKVLNTDESDFRNDPSLTYGMKTSPTFAFRGRAGQKIVTSQKDNIETSFVCEGGEVVFGNILPDGSLDVYVPRDKQNRSTGEEILRTGYTRIGGDLEDPKGSLYKPNPNVAPILLEVIKERTALKDAYGAGQHVFLTEGATLKLGASGVSGINPIAFDATWAVTDKSGNITRPARPPRSDFYNIERFQKVFSL